jgi:hypothetical protein
MPYSVREFQPTPNPNALKCLLDRPVVGPGPQVDGAEHPARSYFTREQAAADPVAAALFAIDGVTNVLIVKDWVTVSKGALARWDKIKPKITSALAGVDGGTGKASDQGGGG